jgi:hypothetical protein
MLSNARDILKSENEMLSQLVGVIEKFAKDYEGVEAENLKCWATELSQYREVNEIYMKVPDDAEFEKKLRDEIDLLDGLRKSITSTTHAAKYWKEMLGGNIDYSKELLR